MSEHPTHDDVPHLEADETIPPRPEEEIADVARAEPQTGSTPVVADPAAGPGDR
jgi:hypothetical protein